MALSERGFWASGLCAALRGTKPALPPTPREATGLGCALERHATALNERLATAPNERLTTALGKRALRRAIEAAPYGPGREARYGAGRWRIWGQAGFAPHRAAQSPLLHLRGREAAGATAPRSRGRSFSASEWATFGDPEWTRSRSATRDPEPFGGIRAARIRHRRPAARIRHRRGSDPSSS